MWPAYSKISIPLLLPISGSRKDPCGWPMRRYPSPAPFYIGKRERFMWLAYAKIPIPCFSLYREALKILVAGLCEDTYPLHLSISGSPKDPCGWPIRRYPSPCFSPYREAIKILVAGLCDGTRPLLLSTSGSPKDPGGWPMRRYPSPASLHIGKPERSLWLAYSKISIPLLLSISGSPKDPFGWPMRSYPCPCLSQYREALKILVAGICEDAHAQLLSMRRYPSPVSLYIGKP